MTTKPKTKRDDVFATLKKRGQSLESELAGALKMAARTVATELQPYIKRGEVMSCRVFDGRGKCRGVEYRVSGTFPPTRPGPKPGPRMGGDL